MGGFHTDLISVDGMKVSGSSVTVMPGAHTVVLRPGSGQENSFGYQPGYHFYSLVTAPLPSRRKRVTGIWLTLTLLRQPAGWKRSRSQTMVRETRGTSGAVTSVTALRT